MDGLTKSILLWRDWRCMGGREKNTMTVQFNITKKPGYGTYLDDATDMPYGKTSEAISTWQEFFGYKPCLFKDGKVVGYLNPNNYAQFEDGTTADITSGNAGDVMVEFPRRGIKISKSGSTVTVSMTKDPDNPDFTYYAHTKGSTKKDYFYVGAYLGKIGYKSSGATRMNSVSNQNSYPVTKWSLSEARTYAKNSGNGYFEFSFYQYLFLQCMYLLQFKGYLDSQIILGNGYSTGYISPVGTTDTNGLIYGTDDFNDHIKLFGIEDFYGNADTMIDGFIIDRNFNVLISNDHTNYNDYGNGYTNYGTVLGNKNGYGNITDVYGSSELGFIPTSMAIKDTSASHWPATYFCDIGRVNSNYMYPLVGGSNGGNKYYGGVFRFEFIYSLSDNTSGIKCGRLCYL